MRDKDGFTPRDAAYATTLTMLLAAHRQPGDGTNTPAFDRAFKLQLARIHNRLLRDSKLDATELPIGVQPLREHA